MTMFDELVEAWKREFQSPELQQLRPSFYKDLASYVRRLNEARHNLDPKSLKAVVIEDEITRLEKLSTQLLNRRLHKISVQPETFHPSELESLERGAIQTLSGLDRDYEMMRKDLLQGREHSPARSREGGYVLVRFEKEVPSIIGVDLKTHGPFLKEDLARLPRENAESLIRQRAAIEITVSNYPSRSLERAG